MDVGSGAPESSNMNSSEVCQHCLTSVRAFERFCPACATDVGFPNVRAALKAEEREALQLRLGLIERELAARGCAYIGDRFRIAVRASSAVLCCSVSRAKALIESDNPLYASFYELVSGGSRRPEQTDIEKDRLLADDLIFPHYREHIRFAALALHGTGVTVYGGCSLVLKEVAISRRATVFETNSVHFCRKQGLGVAMPVPPGHRATWEDRDKLALVKHASELRSDTRDSEFGELLVKFSDSIHQQDFVEVHIYGPLHRNSIARIKLDKITSDIDRTLADDLNHVALAANIDWESPQ
jgi:hypothetical protein